MFERLNRIIAGIFYQDSKLKACKGFRVLLVDGSTLLLPCNHKLLWHKFSQNCFGPIADALDEPHFLSLRFVL